MTSVRTILIAVFGLLTVGSVMPASAGVLGSAVPVISPGDTAGLHLATDRRGDLVTERGSWVKPRSRWENYDYRRDPYYGNEDHRHYRKHYKKKKRRHYRRDYRRGYDEGYYEGRRRSHFDRRRHRDYYRHDYGPRFRGGIYFGDGYFGGGGFRFRY